MKRSFCRALALVVASAPLAAAPQTAFRPEVAVVYDVATGVETVHPLGPGPSAGAGAVRGQAPASGASVEDLLKTWPLDLAAIESQSYPWSAQVRLRFKKDGSFRVGSGTLIGPRHVLTAGHVVHEGSGGDWVTEMEVRPAWDGDTDAYGKAAGIRFGSFQLWTIDGDGDGDMGIVEIDRPVGFLTGWFGYGWNSLGSFFTTNTFHRAGYPGSSTCYTDVPDQLYYGNGIFDSTTTYQLEADVFWSCITGGMSGSGVYWIDGFGDRYVYGTGRSMGGSSAPFDKWDTRITQGKFEFFRDEFVPDSYSDVQVDLVPLAVEVDLGGSAIGAGEDLVSVEYTLGNASLYSPLFPVFYNVDVFLSSDDQIDATDTLIGSHGITHDFDELEALVFSSSVPATIPADTASGQYWIGIHVNANDANTDNNFTVGWDAAEITVNARWPELPSAFLPVGDGLRMDFEGAVWTTPNVAINELDPHTREADPDAWCNVGQHAQGLFPFSGDRNLEMGLAAGSAVQLVANGFVLGMDGGGATDLVLDYMGRNFGDELHDDDGVFLSEDGLDWVPLQSGWGSLGNAWTNVTGVDLTSTSVDTSGEFYLLFAQSDDFPYGGVDGIGIDDVRVHPPGPELSIVNLVGGDFATFTLSGGTPGGLGFLLFSVAGGGPTPTVLGPMDLSTPFLFLPLPLDGTGTFGFTASIAPSLSGLAMWFQGLDLATELWSEGLALVIG